MRVPKKIYSKKSILKRIRGVGQC
nr:ribosomal protein L32 [Viola philippica]